MALVKLSDKIPFGNCYGVYILFIENLVYVGSSKNVYRRISSHQNSLKAGNYKERPILQKAYCKENEHTYYARVYLCSKEELYKSEEYLINKFKDVYGERCVNISIGNKHSKETLLKISNSRKGKFSGENNRNSKLNWIIVNKIRNSKDTNETLSKRYKVSKVTISNIKRNKTWKIE